VETEFTYKSNSTQYNQATDKAQTIHEEYNATRNWPIIQDRIKAGTAYDISAAGKANKPCIIVGSGGSLDETLPHLKDWEGGIICSTSHALTLVKYGAPPTHIYALDPFCTFEEIQGVDWSQYDTKLITTPTVWPTLIEKWPNDIILYRQSRGKSDSFYANMLNIMYSDRECKDGQLRMAAFEPQIKTEVTLFACSPPGQLFSAQVLGYTNIFLTGVDFGYTHGKSRFTEWTCENGEWIEHQKPYDALPQDVKDRAVMSNNGIEMDVVHTFYKKNMISAWRLGLQSCWTIGETTITEMPKVDIEHVIRKQGNHIKGYSAQQIADISETYLAAVGAFVIASDQGYSFVESEKPEEELLKYMEGMRSQYICGTCNSQMVSENEEEREIEECPVCKAKTLHRRFNIDIEGNMKRIRKRIKAANKLKIGKEKPVVDPMRNVKAVYSESMRDVNKS